jgi:hypothetical protein
VVSGVRLPRALSSGFIRQALPSERRHHWPIRCRARSGRCACCRACRYPGDRRRHKTDGQSV